MGLFGMQKAGIFERLEGFCKTFQDHAALLGRQCRNDFRKAFGFQGSDGNELPTTMRTTTLTRNGFSFASGVIRSDRDDAARNRSRERHELSQTRATQTNATADLVLASQHVEMQFGVVIHGSSGFGGSRARHSPLSIMGPRAGEPRASCWLPTNPSYVLRRRQPTSSLRFLHTASTNASRLLRGPEAFVGSSCVRSTRHFHEQQFAS